MTNNRFRGSCLCGAVSFEVEGTFEGFYLCHCGYCRKDTGSAHAANLFTTNATLSWLSGQDTVSRFDLPSTRHGKCFCSVCGSALPRSWAGGKALIVPAGSLDSAVPIRPTSHIFVASRANWDHDLESVPSVDAFPS
jgi:hypothetical protein